MVRFHEIVEAAEQLSDDERAELIDILTRREKGRRRDAFADEVIQAVREHEQGLAKPATPAEIMEEIRRCSES